MAVNFGNRCGHLPEFFRGYTRPTYEDYKERTDTKVPHKKAPGLLRGACSAAKDWYFDPNECIKNKSKRSKCPRLPRLKGVNGSTRQQKSERREGIAGVLQVLINYCDLNTFYCGTWNKDKEGMNWLRLTFIANKLGYTIKRVYRALKDLEKSKYITIKRRLYNHHTGIYQSNEISISKRLFLDLGMSGVSIETSRHYKRGSEGRFTRADRELEAARNGKPSVQAMQATLPDKVNAILKERKEGQPRTLMDILRACR